MTTASDAETIRSLSSDPVPSMPMPLSNQIELLRGLGEKHSDGTETWHTVATVRELNGEDEEALAGLENKPDISYVEYMNAILNRAVLKIGTLDVATTPGMLNRLILPDRDMLFLGVVRATYGLEREMQVICKKCGGHNDVTINLDEDFPIKRPDFDLRETIKVKTKQGIVQLRMPNGEDTISAQKSATTDAELNSAMLARCAVWDEGKAPEDRLAWARKLNVADRRKLVNTLLEIDLGPDLQGVDAQCDTCHSEMNIALDWVSLLLS